MPLLVRQATSILPQREDFCEDASYYSATKVQSSYFRLKFEEQIQSWMSDEARVKKSFSSFKSYEEKPEVKLRPKLTGFRRINWEQVVLDRKSARYFAEKSVSFAELSNLLTLSCGIKEDGKWLKKVRNNQDEISWPKRALPSGGAMYPLEFYVLALRVKGLKPGLYHFSVSRGCLSLLRADVETFNLKHFMRQARLFQNPAAVIFVTAVFNRTRVKYGARALRYILLEAGGVGAQMNLVANAMGVDFCFDGSGYEDRIETLIGIDGRREGLITTLVLGHSKL